MKRIAVLITCHNRKDKTLKCLHALYQCNLIQDYSLDVYLVNDGSTDGTAEAVKNEFSTVQIIQGNGNLYWNRGMHLAWYTAVTKNKYDYYLWLNDDTYLFQDTLTNILYAAGQTNQQSIIVGSTCSAEKKSLSYGGFCNNKLLEPNGRLQECTYFHGNCVLIPSIIFQKIGNLDKLFHHAIGDLDYGLRAQKAGFKSYVLGSYVGTCENHKTFPIWCIKEIPLIDRFKSLYSPVGNSHPYYFFRYEFRHFGLFMALKHLFSIHLRVLIPQLWKNRVQLFSR